VTRSIVIFDRDGTLVDSMSSLVESIATLFHDEFGIDPAETLKIAPRIAMLHPEQMWREFSTLTGVDLTVAMGNESFRRSFTASASGVDTRLFPETLEVLTSLKSKGYRLFLSTSAPHDGLAESQAALGLDAFFELSRGTDLDSGVLKGPTHLQRIAAHLGLTPEELADVAVFVGDGLGDMSIAKTAGIPGIGRITLGNGDELRAAGAVEIVDDLRDVEAAIERIG
jgi:phosphoglycolate phosphatase